MCTITQKKWIDFYEEFIDDLVKNPTNGVPNVNPKDSVNYFEVIERLVLKGVRFGTYHHELDAMIHTLRQIGQLERTGDGNKNGTYKLTQKGIAEYLEWKAESGGYTSLAI